MRRLPPLLVAAALAAGGCTAAPADAPTDETAQTTGPASAPTDDPRRDALLDAIDAVRASVAAAREQLVAARDDGDPGAAATAVAALTADEDLRDGAEADAAPLLPGPETSRQETIDYGDTFTTGLEAARDAGGALAADAQRLLSDTIAGDLGAWQRDAAGVLDAVDDFATGRDVAAAEERILDLPGEGTRALAWALFAARADDGETVAAAAERALAHLDLITNALTELTPETDQES